MAHRIMSNKSFAKWLVNQLGLDGNDDPISQIYINGKPIIDDWNEGAKISIEYIKLEGDINETNDNKENAG